jgi:hypothetical protein
MKTQEHEKAREGGANHRKKQIIIINKIKESLR